MIFTGCMTHHVKRPESGCSTCAFIAELERERDEARQWVARLTRSNVLTCVYCGEAYPPGAPTHGAEVLTEHIKVCRKHPMRAASMAVAAAAKVRDLVDVDTSRRLRAGERLKSDEPDVNAAWKALRAALVEAGYPEPPYVVKRDRE